MRITPRPTPALVVFAMYLVVFYGVWVIADIDYANIGESADTLLRWYVAPLAAGAALLMGAVSYLGWWRPVLRDPVKAGPRWLLVVPATMALVAVAIFASKDLSDTTGRMVLYLLLGSIGVGFCEEVATRGVLVTGFRGRFTEPWVWFLSSLSFGLLHLPNWWFGEGPGALMQVVLAFCTGSALYVTRRLFASLVPAMVLHGVWDFAGFVGATPTTSVVSFLPFAMALLGLIGAGVLVRRDRGRRIENLGVEESVPIPA